MFGTALHGSINRLMCCQWSKRRSLPTRRRAPSTRPRNLPRGPLTTLQAWYSQVTDSHLESCNHHLTTPTGDSKSTTQKLSDQTQANVNSATDTLSSAAQNVQDTASNVAQQASSNAGAAQESSKGYLEQAQEMASNALNTASKAASGR